MDESVIVHRVLLRSPNVINQSYTQHTGGMRFIRDTPQGQRGCLYTSWIRSGMFVCQRGMVIHRSDVQEEIVRCTVEIGDPLLAEGTADAIGPNEEVEASSTDRVAASEIPWSCLCRQRRKSVLAQGTAEERVHPHRGFLSYMLWRFFFGRLPSSSGFVVFNAGGIDRREVSKQKKITICITQRGPGGRWERSCCPGPWRGSTGSRPRSRRGTGCWPDWPPDAAGWSSPWY